MKREIMSWWFFIVLMLVLTIPIFGVLKYFGIIGSTVVERIVFENSFQYQEGMKQRAATLEANIAEIDMMIATGQGDKDQLMAQKSYLNIQLNAMRD